MRLVLRWAGAARGLLTAAAAAALVASVMVTGLALYNQHAVEAGKRNAVRTAPADERSLLLRGSAGADEAAYARRDAAVRDKFADGLAGLRVTIAGARYGTGRQLTGDLGAIARPTGEPVFASMATLQALPQHAALRAGAWPRPGQSPLQIALPERVAGLLKVDVGDQIPLYDRAAERASEVTVAGIWSPRDPRDPYWRLAPGIGADDAAASTTTFGPFVLNEADFTRTFPGTTSAGWVVKPALEDAGTAELVAAGRRIDDVTKQLRAEAVLGSAGHVLTRFDTLAGRLSRANLAGRSALLTPLLLVVVLGAYALVLIAGLLNEDRRAQTALLRARGAARRQLTSLAAREAALVVVPGALLAPLMAREALQYADGSGVLSDLRLAPRLTPVAWAVAGLAAAGCLIAMLGPALRRSGTYVADLAARSRPDRWAVAQRASIDIALVVLAVLAWTQLRQYASPLAGAGNDLGIDPLLSAAPTLGVLAGAVVTLRLLPLATRFAERFVDRKPWTTTMLGMWQAGRRPHAGPVLLLALAVGGSTLAWCLVSTWQRSLVDQAKHQSGADLRVAENIAPPPGRAAQLAALPGVRLAVPAWRDNIRLGRQEQQASVVALDATAAPNVVALSDDLVDGSPRALFDRLAAARAAAAGSELPGDGRRFTGTLRIRTLDGGAASVSATAIFTTADGQVYRVPLVASGIDGLPASFAVDLPETGGRPLRVGGFDVVATGADARLFALQATRLRVVTDDGTSRAVDLGGDKWSVVDDRAARAGVRSVTGDGLVAEYADPDPAVAYGWPVFRSVGFTVVRDYQAAPVPAVVTPQVLTALSIQVGQTTPLSLPGGSFPIVVVGVADALPTTDSTRPALLLDLPSAAIRLLHESGTTRSISEWWVSTEPAQHGAAATAAGQLAGATVVDRQALADAAARNPYWLGARSGLLAAALGALLLAVVGIGVDVWATARRRVGELAVLNTLGAAPRLLARALMAEQGLLAGIGVAVGLVVGTGVGATMAPLVILTPSAGRPVPEPAFELPWGPVSATAATLLVISLALSSLIATTIRNRVPAAQLRIGADR
jgi:hypothetical protein